MIKPLNPLVKKQLELVRTQLPPLLIIHGEYGIGKRWVAESLLEGLGSKVKVELFEVEQSVLDIQKAREIIRSSYQKVPKGHKRIVVLATFENSTPEAQNALLKQFEEPIDNLHYILATTTLNQVLPTIISRAQLIRMIKPSRSSSAAYLEKTGQTKSRIIQALAASNNLPMLAEKILNSEVDGYESALEGAKQFLASDKYHRFVMNKAQPLEVEQLLVALQRIVYHFLSTGLEKKTVNEWLSRQELLAKTNHLVANNVQSRLVHTNLILNL